MSVTQSTEMADVRDMYMAHTMFRREFALLPDLIRGVAPGDTRRAEVVGAHADLLCRVLHLHHEGEDRLLWPRLAERGGAEAAAIVPVMEQQHHVIEEANERVAALLPGFRAEGRDGVELAEVFEQLLPALMEHMTMEEERILPLAEKHVTAAEWKQLGEHGLNEFAKKELPLTFGLMMYEGDPEVIKGVLAEAPLPARLLMPVIGPRIFASHARRVHGTATPPQALAP
jgi:hemerythrin-like domain-containing protein